MDIDEFREKFVKEIENNFESFKKNMKSEGIKDVCFCDWVDIFIAWMEWGSSEECYEAYDDGY